MNQKFFDTGKIFEIMGDFLTIIVWHDISYRTGKFRYAKMCLFRVLVLLNAQ